MKLAGYLTWIRAKRIEHRATVVCRININLTFNQITMVKFAYTILYVQDVERSLSFYEKAFDLERKFISPDNQYGELQTGSTTLSFASVELAKSNLPGGFTESRAGAKPFAVEIAFATDDVPAQLNKAVAAGATELAAPKQKPWGQTVAYLADPDGFLVEICTPMG